MNLKKLKIRPEKLSNIKLTFEGFHFTFRFIIQLFSIYPVPCGTARRRAAKYSRALRLL